MILSAFLARIREMSSNRGVVSAVSNLAAFGSAQGYCEGRVKKTDADHPLASGSIGINRDSLANTDATKQNMCNRHDSYDEHPDTSHS